MNKYQEALDELEQFVHSEYDGTGKLLEDNLKYINALQELVDQTKTPTEEEIKKEWEELDFEFCYHPNQHNILNIFKDGSVIIHLWKDRTYDFDSVDGCLSIKLHQLLTKTMKWLGWFE